MNIAVVGLGLIGGSFCKALKANTFHHIMGIDTDKETVRKALEQGALRHSACSLFHSMVTSLSGSMPFWVRM